MYIYVYIYVYLIKIKIKSKHFTSSRMAPKHAKSKVGNRRNTQGNGRNTGRNMHKHQGKR